MTSPPPIPAPADFPEGPSLVLDLSEVASISAAGIGELVGLRTRLDASGGKLVLVNVAVRVYQALEEARLTDLLGARRSGVVWPAADEEETMEREDAERLVGKV